MGNQMTDVAELMLQKCLELSKLSSQLVELQETQGAQQTQAQKGKETELGKWLEKIYADQVLNNIEFQQLRDEADRRVDDLKSLYPQVTELAGFQQAADDAVQQMQKGMLSFRKLKLKKEPNELVLDAYAFQVAYIKACFDRFTQSV